MRKYLLAAGFILLAVSSWLIFTAAAVEPARRNMIYIHVPASICSLACFTVLFICSVQYLRTSRAKWDCVSAACSEAGLIFATLLNVTGMLFAHLEWGLWWTPSVRLISSAAMWFLYLAYIVLRSSLPAGRKQARVCAVFAVIAFIDVPLVIISARFMRDIHRPGFSFQSSWQFVALALAVAGVLIVTAVLVSVRASRLNRALDTKTSASPA